MSSSMKSDELSSDDSSFSFKLIELKLLPAF